MVQTTYEMTSQNKSTGLTVHTQTW